MLRQIINGSEIASQRQSQVSQHQIILSRIDARNGAMGLVPTELDGAVVTNDFPTFNVNRERLVPAFLGWLCRTSDFTATLAVFSLRHQFREWQPAPHECDAFGLANSFTVDFLRGRELLVWLLRSSMDGLCPMNIQPSPVTNRNFFMQLIAKLKA